MAGQPVRVGVKVAPDSVRIGGSGRVNRPVRVRVVPVNSHEAPPIRGQFTARKNL